MTPRPDGTTPALSVVLPAYEEEAGIGRALDEISRVMEGCGVPFEIVVVDDGSRDATFDRVKACAARDARVRGLRFSRNFGKEAALSAGLRTARGEAVVTMDADLQHPPSLLPAMIEAWRNGAKVVHAVKQARPNDGLLVRLRARLFNWMMLRLGGIDLEEASDFKLLDREVADILASCLPERKRFYRGLAAWVGYPALEVPFAVAERPAGGSRWSTLHLIELAITALVSFTSAPLRIVTVLGLLTLALSGLLAIDTLWSWLHDQAVSGFATIVLALLIIGSFIMISLGIIGEYIAKIYEEVKRRPHYLVSEMVNVDSTHDAPQSAPRPPHALEEAPGVAMSAAIPPSGG
jgi:glycosyltransferase involved in cell wall biosynthesis